MQLFEIKNDIAKILYSPSENHLLLADFLLIEDVNQSLIAQIIDIESSEKSDTNIITVKFALSINKNANLSTYNGYTPSKDARIIYIEPKEIAQLIQSPKTNIFWGYLASHPSTPISLGLSFLREKPYIQCDKIDNSTIIATNILYGLQKNKKRTIIVDFDGRYKKLEATTRINISKEYKLPLNFDAFDFISENDLEDCSSENRAIIQGILLELQSYVATTEDGFIPFDIFKNVIDEECRKNPIPELIIFKNKLIKYQQKSLFAQNKDQFNFLNRILSKNTTTIVDASNIDEKWHRFILETVAAQIDKKCYLIVNINDTNANKKTIKTIYDNDNIRAIVLSPFNTKNSLQLKTICKNLILFAPIEKVNDFEIYSSFLYKLNQKEFIIWSENTFYMPLILKLKALDKDYLAHAISQEIKSDVDRIFTAKTSAPIDDEIPIPDKIIIKKDSEEDSDKKQSMNEKIIRAISSKDKPQTVSNTQIKEEPISQVSDELTEEDLDFLDDINSITMSVNETSIKTETDTFSIIEDEQQPIENPADKEDSNIIDLDNDEFDEFDDEEEIIFVENNEASTIKPESNIIDIEELDKITDKVKTATIVEQKIEQPKIIEQEKENVKNEPLKSKPGQILEQTPAEKPIIERKKPSVPIYEAKTAEPTTNTIKFKEGNFVYHAKYGKGIVEKIITYGNKTLCSIEFDNVGRRLLDPNLADIKLA